MRDGWLSWLGSLVAFVALLTDQTLARSPQPSPAASSSSFSWVAPHLIATPDIPEGLPTLISRAPTLTTSGNEIVATEVLANGITRETTTDARNGYLKKLYTTGPGGELQNHSYTWDFNGNLLSRTDGVNDESETFDYDDLDRLEWSEVAGESRRTYVYDEGEKGNLVHRAESSCAMA